MTLQNLIGLGRTQKKYSQDMTPFTALNSCGKRRDHVLQTTKLTNRQAAAVSLRVAAFASINGSLLLSN